MEDIMRRKEYEDIFAQYVGAGFIFTYFRKHLSRSKVVFREETTEIDNSKHNRDSTPLYIKCKSCQVLMDYKTETDKNLNGWWVCSSCGARVKETTVYRQLERENRYSKEFANLNDYCNIPDGCEACGGPYPDCEDSCPLFDEN